MTALRRTAALWLIPFAALLVWAQSSAPARSASSAKPAKSASSASSASASSGPQIDINSASMAELKSIPGIGDAYANKIIAGRPYKSKAQLKSRNILPARVYDQAKDHIVAKQK